VTRKVGTLRSSILTVNNTNTSDGVYYFTSDRNDGNKLKIGQGNTINENVIVTIDPTSGISGSLVQATEITGSLSGSLIQATEITGSSISGSLIQATQVDISEMGGLVIAQRSVLDTGTTTNISLPISMAQLSADFSVTFTVPPNGKVSIQISAFFAHVGSPGVTPAVTAQVAIHDGSGYVYDVGGVQLDSQEFWQSEGENYMQSMEFIVTKDSGNVALVPGASHTFNAHFQASLASLINLTYGANYLPFVMKAVTVPNTIL
jgi:hypothetical protein